MYSLQGSASKRVENGAEFHLPDEIVIDILSRLPAKDVLRCRSVCRKWMNLTANRNRDFVDLHIKFGVPMLLAEEHSLRKPVDPFLLDNWWETTSSRSVIQRFGKKYVILFSHNGLIVSEQFYSNKQGSRNFIIFNPINGENVTINLLEGIPWGDVYGVYFHPLLKEYCTLWSMSLKSQSESEHVVYRVLKLGAKPCWKTIRNPWNKNYRIRVISPVFIDGYLYWVVENGEDGEGIYHNSPYNGSVTLCLHIMEFDIVREELKMLPCPVPGVFDRINCNISLVNIEGCLSLVQIVSDTELEVGIHIWALKDGVQRLWKCSDYRINLDLYPSNFQFKGAVLKAICVANGKLAIQSDTTLFVCNLERGTIRIVEKKNQRYAAHDVFFYSHLMSFASLKNCKSNIYMDENGEVVDKEETKSLVLNNMKKKSKLYFSISKESDNKDDAGVDNEDSSSSESEDSSSSDSEDSSSSDDQGN